jgi:O-antigen/teichoic acid export membrane protein
LRDGGLDLALIHQPCKARCDQLPSGRSSLTQGGGFGDEALVVHFLLRLALAGIYVLLLLAVAPALRIVFSQKQSLVPLLWVLAIGEIAVAVGATPAALLRREMRFQELAILQVLTSLSMSIVGPLMAWRGWGVWAIVGERTSGVLVATIVVWTIIRPWRPRQLLKKFSRTMVKWYLDYGKYVFTARGLTLVLDQFDDFWVGTVLGTPILGLYSKAYEFANYPNRIVSAPVVGVFYPAFARVQHDRPQLSRAYTRVASLIVRFGFGVGGLAILLAPAVIPPVLGEQWRPMVSVFQWMSVYTLLSPLLSITGNLVNAVGAPRISARTRLVQTLLFVPSVLVGAYLGGADGVAIAVDLAMLVGIGFLLNQVTTFVDVSVRQLLCAPLLSVFIALLPAVSVLAGWGRIEDSRGLQFLARSSILRSSDAVAAGIAGGGFLMVYGLVLWMLERDRLIGYVRMVKSVLQVSK